MNRTTPPTLATWMLEHCTAGDSNEALSGDLLQGYSTGLSNGWYWRQVFAACAVSWSEALRVRTSLLLFSVLWSMLSPAWTVLVHGIQSAPMLDRVFLSLGGFWVLPALAGWLLLNGFFLWAGMLVYIFTLSAFGRVFRRREIRRAFVLAPLVYAPVFVWWLLVCCLDWSAAFAHQKPAVTALGQIGDLRMVADVIRFPYLVTLVCVLWNVVSRPRGSYRLVPVEGVECSREAGVPELQSVTAIYTVNQFFFFMGVGTGLSTAMIAAILLFRMPHSHLHSLSAVLLWAVLYVVVGVLAGAGGSWLYWKGPMGHFRDRNLIPFGLFALVCASGWVWIPSMVVFSEYSSSHGAVVAVIGTAFLTAGLRNAATPVLGSLVPDSRGDAWERSELFAQSLQRAPWEAHGYVVAALLYAGVFSLAFGLQYVGDALLALSVFLLFRGQAIVPRQNLAGNDECRRAAWRLAYVAIPAILLTAWACLDEAGHRDRIAEAKSGTNAGGSTNGDALRKAGSESTLAGYESLILWPVKEKKQVVAPLPENSFLAPGATRALMIPFTGAYWYLQSPDTTPGPAAHQSHGSPIDSHIASINSRPLVMHAHQYLGKAIPVARLSEIEIEIENRDNRKGLITLAVLLTDGRSRRKTTLYLGQQPIKSTEPENFSWKSDSVFEKLVFVVPGNAKLREFDEITVMMLPDVEHSLEAPRVSVKRFQLLPH